eukprot:GEZU01017979.1.p1 GENE.GEZU01017979.1~~GEZU01017979.1.p1  ORF type:complete len:281 (+),score=88.11 GEZU01017979.1:253-1095(+)
MNNNDNHNMEEVKQDFPSANNTNTTKNSTSPPKTPPLGSDGALDSGRISPSNSSSWDYSRRLSEEIQEFKYFVESPRLPLVANRTSPMMNIADNMNINNNNNNNERVALERITLDLAPLKKILFELQKTKGRNQTEEDLDKLFRQSKQLILKTLFADMQNVVYSSIKHSPRYCDFDLDAVKNNPDYANSGLASRPPKYNAQLGEWDIWCFCGSPMRLCRLKTDRVQYKYCFCGEKMGVHVVKVGTLIYVCSNAPHCERTHSARQANIKFAVHVLCCLSYS